MEKPFLQKQREESNVQQWNLGGSMSASDRAKTKTLCKLQNSSDLPVTNIYSMGKDVFILLCTWPDREQTQALQTLSKSIY